MPVPVPQMRFSRSHRGARFDHRRICRQQLLPQHYRYTHRE